MNTYPIRDSPLLRSAGRTLAPLQQSRRNHRSCLTSARSFHLSEEIAFYQGEKREKQTIDSTFQRLVRLRIKEMSNCPSKRYQGPCLARALILFL